MDRSTGSGISADGAFSRRFSRREMTFALAGGAFASIVYLSTAAPTVTAEDSGELAAAVWTLGIPHPPGYPLYVLVGKLFVTLFPFGEVAFRLNILSGLLTGVSVSLAALLSIRLSVGALPGVSAALVAGFMPSVWSQATITEVYPLAAVVFLSAVHLTILFLSDPTANRLWALGYAGGLCLTAHPSMVFLIPGLVLAVLGRLGVGALRRRALELMCACGFALLGFSLYLYLPLRSLADPVMDWGNPESLQGFLSHILRIQYAGSSLAPKHPVLDRVLYVGYIAVFEVGPVLLILSLLGMRSVIRLQGEAGARSEEAERAHRAFKWAYVLWLLCFSLGFLFVLTISFQRSTLALNSVFFIPLLLLLVPPAGAGIERLTLCVAKRWAQAGRGPSWALCSAIPAVFLLCNYSSQDKSSYTIGRDYAESILKTLPESSVYIPSGDHANFPVLYLQIVEGQRPDVVMADKYGYLDPAVLRRIASSDEEYQRIVRLSRPELERWLIDRSGRPTFVHAKRELSEVPTDRFVSTGVLYRVDRERKPLSREEEDALWASYTFSNLDEDFLWAKGPRDVSSDYIVSEILFHRAEAHFQRKEEERALEVLRHLRRVASGYKEILQNAGSLLTEKGMVKEAGQYYEAALEVDGDYAICRRNYAWSLLKGGLERDKAIALAEQSLEEIPPDPVFAKLLGDAYREEKRYRNACDCYLVAARLSERDSEAWKLAGEICELYLQRPAHARLYYSESLKRKPTQPELIEKVHGKAARSRYEAAAREVSDQLLQNLNPLGSQVRLDEGALGALGPK